MLETERIILRKFTLDDLDELIKLRSDAEVNKYLGGTRLQNADAIARRMQSYLDSYERFGFGACAMIWKETGEMFGWSGLQPLEDTGEIEVGYGMANNFWGKGIGYECASAWLEYGFETAGLEKIVAISIPENTASWRIMEKCGMRYERIETHYDLECVFYTISKNEYFNLKK